ncbi:MAG: class I SAM-dependent methyltransferase [Micromonosporaceae bacterium]
MVDAIFEHPRLAATYDALDPDRSDLDVYAAIAHQLGARRAVDLGCGTGTFALLLAERGLDVTGVDPAGGSLNVARAKPGAERVRWIHGDATSIPPVTQVDLVTMTGNVAQAIVERSDWDATLRAVRDALRPGGALVFETRDPAFRSWREWNRKTSYQVTDIPGVGSVERWVDLTRVDGPLVSFRHTWVFVAAGQTLTSDSTLRFRERDEVAADLAAHGYLVSEVRDAPDRPGREFVFFARRPD